MTTGSPRPGRARIPAHRSHGDRPPSSLHRIDRFGSIATSLPRCVQERTTTNREQAERSSGVVCHHGDQCWVATGLPAETRNWMPHATNPDDGVEIYYEVEGKGPPLLLLHGFMQDLEFWRIAGYTAALRNQHLLILVDDRGHGRSSKPYTPTSYTMDLRIADMLAVVDDLGVSNVHFWGYSLGGYIGFGLSELARDRLFAAIIGGSHPHPLDPEVINRAIQSLESGMSHYIASVEEETGRLPEPYRKRRLAQDPQALIASMVARRDLMSSYDRNLAHRDTPFLLYAGTEDAICNQVRVIANNSPSAVFAAINGVDHGEVFIRSDLVLPHAEAFLRRATNETAKQAQQRSL